MLPIIRDRLPELERMCREHRVRRLFLVGSALGDRFDASRSDVDFLVEFEAHERGGFDDEYLRLRAELEQLLARPIDLIEARAVRNPYLIASLNRTKQLLYAA